MKTAIRKEEGLRDKRGFEESKKVDPKGWRNKGVGELILWTEEEIATRKINNDASMAKRDVIMAKIKSTVPGT